MINLSKLRLQVRRIKALRNALVGVRWMYYYLLTLPDWARWLRKRQMRKAQIERVTPGEPSRPLHIVFVTHNARVREFKLAHAARLCGHRVTLVAQYVQSNEMVSKYFDAFCQVDNPWQILILLDELRPDVTHLFVNYNNIQMLPVLLYAVTPVVYDPYDCLQGMFKPEYQPDAIEITAERIAFARADHICARNLEPLYLRREFGYAMSGTIYFPEYCWSTPVEREARQLSDNDRIQVVYCGGIWPENQFPPEEAGYAQFLEIGRVFAQQRIDLHLYPAPLTGMGSFEVFFQSYLEEAKHNPYFHLHRPVSQTELQEELVQYDAGMFFHGKDINKSLGRQTEAKMHFSGANKLFDYVEAGLVVLLHGGFHQTGLVRHYGEVIVPRDLGEIRRILTEALAKNSKPHRSAAIAFHARRLDVMYRDLVRL